MAHAPEGSEPGTKHVTWMFVTSAPATVPTALPSTHVSPLGGVATVTSYG